MRNLMFALVVVCAVGAPVAGVAQTNLPPAWGTTGSSSGSPFKKVPAKPATATRPASAQPAAAQPLPQPVPVSQPAVAQPMASQPVYLPPPAPAPVYVPAPVPIPQPVTASAPVAAPVHVAPPVYRAQPVYSAPLSQAPQPAAESMPSEPVAEPEDLAPAAQPVATAPVYQAQPVYAAPTPQAPVAEQEYSAPAPEPVQQSVPEPVQQPVYTAPAYAPPAQPVYAAPVQQPVQAAPVAQPVYLPSNALPLQSALPPMQAAPAPLPTLNPPTKAERKRAKANQQDRAIVAAAAQGMPTQNPLNPLSPLNPLNPLNPWIDVSAALSPAITPVYEGNPPLQVKFTMDMEHGAALDLSQIDMGTHTGTHVDAPLHFVRGAPSIDEVPLDRLIGPAVVLDIDPRVIAITGAELMKYKWQGAKRVIFRTRNSVNSWIIDPQFHRDFTFLAPDAAQMLADNGVLLVGIDYLSIEQFGAFKPLTHQILLSRGIPIVEGLDLRTVIPGEYDFMVLPLKILGHEAAPARAVLRAR